MTRNDFIVIYLSLSLLAVQYMWIKDIRQAEYQRGRAEVLEIMAELTDTGPYVSPKKGGKK